MEKFKHHIALDTFNEMTENKIIVSYVGPVDDKMLTLLGESIEKTLWESQIKGKKFFRIFIELSHNIFLYSNEKHQYKGKQSGIGLFMIREFEDHYEFSAGNIVKPEDKKILKERCDIINSLDRTQLRALKRENRKYGNEKGGGNIGLVQVALLTHSKLDYIFFPTEHTTDRFFMLNVRLMK